ncbi:hypothetical protein [Cytobacillus kochii]|uniref:hypothetical protein n=1 Tax=Cytobacillus kochii TaxID=859143 RepID=UPI0024816938|nr:hypothetical protein [Cytobacillus kochii]
MSEKNDLGIWIKLSEHDLYKMFREMRYDDEMFKKFQKKRIYKGIASLFVGIMLSLFNPVLILLGVAISIYQWWSDYRKVKSFYNNFLFKKQLAFSKFGRMLIPYLLQTNATLYNVLNRMLLRIEEGHVKQCLEALIIEMNDYPNSEVPFKKFAIEASGTDNSILFMTTLYDYQQHSFDPSVINELGKMASEELFNGVDEIIDFKLRKFNMFPTKLTMISLLIVAGYMGAVFINLFQSITL